MAPKRSNPAAQARGPLARAQAVEGSPALPAGPAALPPVRCPSMAEATFNRLNPGQKMSTVNVQHFAMLQEAFQLVMARRPQHL